MLCGRLHLVLDTLSRLQPKAIPKSNLETDMLKDVAHVDYVLIEATENGFKARLKQAVGASSGGEVISGGRQHHEDAERPMRRLRFLLTGTMKTAARPCILKPRMHEVCQQTHVGSFYQGFNQAYDRVKASFSIHKLSKYLRIYIKYCF
jgi:hypothetical protein